MVGVNLVFALPGVAARDKYGTCPEGVTLTGLKTRGTITSPLSLRERDWG